MTQSFASIASRQSDSSASAVRLRSWTRCRMRWRDCGNSSVACPRNLKTRLCGKRRRRRSLGIAREARKPFGRRGSASVQLLRNPRRLCCRANGSPILSNLLDYPFIFTLTILPSPGETSFVARMDASQEVSLDPTAAPSPDLDFSSHQFTTNGGGDGFSPARSGATATAIHADRLDLASVSFTTTDPAVQSVRYAARSRAGRWPLPARRDSSMARKVLERVEQRRQPTAEERSTISRPLKEILTSAGIR